MARKPIGLFPNFRFNHYQSHNRLLIQFGKAENSLRVSDCFYVFGEKVNYKIKKIKELSQEEFDSINKTKTKDFLRAYIGCLTDEETKNLLLYSCVNDFKIRDLILRKLKYDFENGLNATHKQLITALIKLATKSEYREALSIAVCLTKILNHAKGNDQIRIIKFLLMSERICFRKKAYKFLVLNYHKSYSSLVRMGWEKYKDYGSIDVIKVIIRHLDCDYLYKNRFIISEHIDAGWLMAKLYIEIGKVYPETIEELFDYHIPTYCYCLAQLQRQLPEANSRLIVLPLKDDDKRLLLWSLGRIKEWELIKKLESECSSSVQQTDNDFLTDKI